MKTINKILTIAVIPLMIIGCSENRRASGQFRTVGYNHFASAKMIADKYCGGIRKFGNNLDFDSDKMNDRYIFCNNGVLYANVSRRLIQGQDNAAELTWDKKDISDLKLARKGEYPSI